MSRQPVSVGGRADVAEVRHELLGRLGLRENASDQDVETVHNGVVEFLELAPHEVKSWAAAQTADVDEAFALLSGPEQDLIPPQAQTPVSLDKGSLPSDESDQTLQPPPAPYVAPAAPTATKPRRTQMLGAGVILLVVAVVFGVWYMGKGSGVPGISGAPTNTQATTAAPAGSAPVAVDQVKVAALMKKISANPKDKASLQGLGNIYFAAADYKNASLWEQKILAVDPKDQVGLLSLGAAQFNLGNAAVAKKNWLVAARLYPKVAEVHYDLGFLYMSQTPPDKVNMNAEWSKVIAIDPNSSLAKTVATHITGTKPTASATPSAK
jgi:tetratricopeptide (TPR) repeat protein